MTLSVEAPPQGEDPESSGWHSVPPRNPPRQQPGPPPWRRGRRVEGQGNFNPSAEGPGTSRRGYGNRGRMGYRGARQPRPPYSGPDPSLPRIAEEGERTDPSKSPSREPPSRSNGADAVPVLDAEKGRQPLDNRYDRARRPRRGYFRRPGFEGGRPYPSTSREGSGDARSGGSGSWHSEPGPANASERQGPDGGAQTSGYGRPVRASNAEWYREPPPGVSCIHWAEEGGGDRSRRRPGGQGDGPQRFQDPTVDRFERAGRKRSAGRDPHFAVYSRSRKGSRMSEDHTEVDTALPRLNEADFPSLSQSAAGPPGASREQGTEETAPSTSGSPPKSPSIVEKLEPSSLEDQPVKDWAQLCGALTSDDDEKPEYQAPQTKPAATFAVQRESYSQAVQKRILSRHSKSSSQSFGRASQGRQFRKTLPASSRQRTESKMILTKDSTDLVSNGQSEPPPMTNGHWPAPSHPKEAGSESPISRGPETEARAPKPQRETSRLKRMGDEGNRGQHAAAENTASGEETDLKIKAQKGTRATSMACDAAFARPSTFDPTTVLPSDVFLQPSFLDAPSAPEDDSGFAEASVTREASMASGTGYATEDVVVTAVSDGTQTEDFLEGAPRLRTGDEAHAIHPSWETQTPPSTDSLRANASYGGDGASGHFERVPAMTSDAAVTQYVDDPGQQLGVGGNAGQCPPGGYQLPMKYPWPLENTAPYWYYQGPSLPPMCVPPPSFMPGYPFMPGQAPPGYFHSYPPYPPPCNVPTYTVPTVAPVIITTEEEEGTSAPPVDEACPQSYALPTPDPMDGYAYAEETDLKHTSGNCSMRGDDHQDDSQHNDVQPSSLTYMKLPAEDEERPALPPEVEVEQHRDSLENPPPDGGKTPRATEGTHADSERIGRGPSRSQYSWHCPKRVEESRSRGEELSRSSRRARASDRSDVVRPRPTDHPLSAAALGLEAGPSSGQDSHIQGRHDQTQGGTASSSSPTASHSASPNASVRSQDHDDDDRRASQDRKSYKNGQKELTESSGSSIQADTAPAETKDESSDPNRLISFYNPRISPYHLHIILHPETNSLEGIVMEEKYYYNYNLVSLSKQPPLLGSSAAPIVSKGAGECPGSDRLHQLGSEDVERNI